MSRNLIKLVAMQEKETPAIRQFVYVITEHFDITKKAIPR